MALDWRPLFYWSEAQVWEACGASVAELLHRRQLWLRGQQTDVLAGWPAHPAYVMGNRRLSCAFYIMGSVSDLTIQNPTLYSEYLERERRGVKLIRRDSRWLNLGCPGKLLRYGTPM